MVDFFIMQASQAQEITAPQKKLMEALIETRVSVFNVNCAEWGKKKIEQAIIEDGADVNGSIYINKDTTWLPLTYAVVNADLETCLLLIEHKADVNGEDELGTTPLMMALLFLRPDKVKLLLDHNANITKKNSEDEAAWNCIEPEEIHFTKQEKRRAKIIDLIAKKLEEKN